MEEAKKWMHFRSLGYPESIRTNYRRSIAGSESCFETKSMVESAQNRIQGKHDPRGGILRVQGIDGYVG